MILVTILQKKFKGTGEIHFSKIFHLAQYAQNRIDMVLVFQELAKQDCLLQPRAAEEMKLMTEGPRSPKPQVTRPSKK